MQAREGEKPVSLGRAIWERESEVILACKYSKYNDNSVALHLIYSFTIIENRKSFNTSNDSL